MKLKAKILSISLIPVILLGTIMFLVAADRIANGIYDESYVGMHATTLAIRDIFEMGYEGDYHLDEQGELWKGDELNISQSLDIVDHIKENTGLDVTIFWNDNRILTSLADENGKRQIGTKASSKIADIVLHQGKSYQNKHVDILGSEYVVYYEPFCQIGTDDVVGMIFLGMPQASVSNIINKVRFQLLLIIVIAVILSVAVIYSISNKIVALLNKNMRLLGTMSGGSLDIVVENDILERRDEIGGLGRSIESLKDKLGQIVHNISTKSDRVLEESNVLKETTETVYQIMKELDHAAQSISESSTHQTEDSVQTSQNVVKMGEMIEHNNVEVTKINETSNHIMKLSEETMFHFDDLNKMMNHVREALYFLAEQTNLTSNSVVKISSATEIITSIAAQTNLLSLNASIEAARAGETGNGFAVVAAEIQKLSQESKTAAEEIKEIVADLNNHSSHAVKRMEETRAAIEKQTEDIAITNQKVKDVNDGVSEMVDGMQEIMKESRKLEEIRTDTIAIVQNSASASEENLASVEEIMAGITKVYADIEKIAENVKVLHVHSAEMKERIKVFSV